MKRDIFARFGGNPTGQKAAFTRVDLAVVLATLTVIAVMLLPALAATQDRSNRALCQYRLRQVGVVATLYAADNGDNVMTARAGIPNTVSLSGTNASKYGLRTNDYNSIWTCPNRPTLPLYEASALPPQWVIGYQYFGGLTTWNSPFGTFPARSPIKLSQAKPYWTLASDPMIKIGSFWASQAVSPMDPRYGVYTNIPPHWTTNGKVPQGGNQVFCDGSVQWIDLEKMYLLTGWAGAYGSAYCAFYQDSKDFTAPLLSALPALSVTP